MKSTTPRILMIDDDEDDYFFFAEALKEIDPDAECLHANSGDEGLAMLHAATHLPNCIFLDLNMPRMNGRECLEHIKKTDKLRHIPVIIYSTSKNQADIQETKRLGATTFLTKPSDLKDLRDAIAAILARV